MKAEARASAREQQRGVRVAEIMEPGRNEGGGSRLARVGVVAVLFGDRRAAMKAEARASARRRGDLASVVGWPRAAMKAEARASRSAKQHPGYCYLKAGFEPQ